jgi:hypothetical protein
LSAHGAWRDYFAARAIAFDAGETGDCWRHAWQLAALLANAGARPSIHRLRDHQRRDGQLFVAPLTALRRCGAQRPTWNTHYVCVDAGLAYDPLLAEPVPLDSYATRLFGRAVDGVECVSADVVAAHLAAGDMPRPQTFG